MSKEKRIVMVNHVALIMYGWCEIPRDLQKEMVLSWICYSNVGNRLSGHRLFLLPTIGKIPLNFSVDYASELSSMLFCLNGLCSILGLRHDFIKKLKTHPKGFPIIPHRLTGKTGDQSNKNKKKGGDKPIFT